MEINHNKIINQAAREILKPNGLFQKGQSRVWIDDNGWFLIIVEFQPSSYDKGSYLNVSVHYLWGNKDYLSFDYGHRVNKFVAYDGDENKFHSDMIRLSEIALDKVKEYRNFSNLLYAKEKIISHNAYASSREFYDKMMICGLAKDVKSKTFYSKLKFGIIDSQLGWEKEYYNELIEKISPIISDSDKLYEYIISKIQSTREMWHNKSSMKKLRTDWSIENRKYYK